MFTNTKSIRNQVMLWSLALLLLFNTAIPPASAAGVGSKKVGTETLASVQAPSQVAAPPDTQPDQWTTVAKSVYSDVYEAPDPQMNLLEDKIVALDESSAPSEDTRVSTLSEDEEEGPPTDDEVEPVSQLGEQGIYLLLQQGAEPIDIYWIEYLMRLTGQTGDQIWQQHQQQKLKWKDQEKQYHSSTPTVTGDVYIASSQKEQASPSASVATDSLQTASFTAPKLQAAQATSLSSALSSALDDDTGNQKFQDLGKQEYADRAKDEENISSSSGSLDWSKTQIHLPGRDGLDLDIGVRYDSTNTSPYTRRSSKTRSASVYKGNYMYQYNDLGMGWSFQFPSVEGGSANANYVDFVYNSGTGQSYPVNLYAVESLVLKRDSGLALQFVRNRDGKDLFSNGEYQAYFYVQQPNGTREYFSSYGMLLGKVDRYGNTITYHYQDRTVNLGTSSAGEVLSYITDTMGRKVTFDYETTLNQGDEFKGENITVTVYNPQGQATQRVVYTKSRVKLLQNGVDDGYVPLLQSITNQAGEQQTFDYNPVTVSFRFNSSKLYAQEPNFLLNRVQSPRLTTHYDYEQTDRVPGARHGDSIEYRMKSRYDTYNQANGSDSTPVNQVDYTYVGDYTKYYYTYNTDGGMDHSLYHYSQTAHIKSTTASGEKTITNLYNGLHQLLSTETRTSNGEINTTNNQIFDPTYIYKPIKIQTILQDSSGTTTRYKDIVYADWGGSQSETDDLITDDYNNADTKARHTVSYTYDPIYHQTTSKTWYQNGGAALTEKYAYTGTGRLQSVTNALGETTTYTYDASPANSNQIQRMTQQKSIRSGVTSSITTTFGADYSYAYPTEQTSTFTNADQSKRTVRQTMIYDAGTGLLTQQTDSDGKVTTTSYDALGRPIKVVQPSMTNLDGTVYAIEDQYAYTNRVYSTGADSTNAGVLTLRVDSIRQYTNQATGAVTVLNRQAAYYDGFGFLRVMETYNDSNGWTRSQYHPDDLGRAIYAVDALGNTQTASYNAWDQQSEFTDAEGNLYISKPLLTKQQTQHFTIAASNVATYRSNPDNTSIRLNLLQQNFDAYGHKIKVVAYKDGAANQSQPIQESYTYDLTGNVLTYTDPNGNQNSKGVTTAYTYDALNRLTSVQDAIDQTSRYTYDGGGGLSSVVISNPSGKSETLYTKNYNEQGLLTTKSDSINNQTQMNYNARGLTEQMVDRNGTNVKYTYDERGQQTSATMTAASTNTLASGTLQTKSIYGAGGNILTDRHELYINNAKVATQTSTSDKLDRVTSLTSSAADYATRLDASYDPLDRVTSQTNTLNGTSFQTSYGYTKSRLTQIQTNGAGTRTTAATANVGYAYTPSGQVQGITFPTLADGTTLQETMTYDPLNRLTRLSNTKGDATLSVYSYQYDNNGNIVSVTEQVKDGTTQTSTYSYDKLSRLSGVKRADGTETQYSYDLRGNRVTQKDSRNLPDEKATNYRYDLQNTLISAAIEGIKTTFDYLPDGLRWKKTNGSKVTQYSYNGSDQVIGDQTSNGTLSSYIRGDRVLVKKDLTNQKDYYYLYNGHGDVVQMIGTDGSLVNSYQYDEWGNLTQQKETVANEFKYAGETYDAETGLYYLKARYYDPNVGRFVNEDTVEGEVNNPLSLNIYGYVSNNPLIYIDPTGHQQMMDGNGFDSRILGGNGVLYNKSGSVAWDYYLDWRKKDQDSFDKLANSGTNISTDQLQVMRATISVIQYLDDGTIGMLLADAGSSKLAKSMMEKYGLKSTVKTVMKCECFTAGTKVKTDQGEKNIEDIKVGDQVLSKDEKTGEVKYKVVTATFNHETNEIYQIHIGNQKIESTYNHPFYVKNKGWTFVKDLKVGDLLVQSNGNTIKIDSIELLHKKVTVYNMTVDEFHTYFVSDLGIWVHNTGCFNLDIKPVVSNSKLQNIVKDLYKGQNMPNVIGNGTTMDSIRYELKTGQPVGGKFHSQKGQDYSRALQKLLNGGSMDANDKTAAQAIYDDLQKALAGN